MVVAAVNVAVAEPLLSAAVLKRVHQGPLESRGNRAQHSLPVHYAQLPLPQVCHLAIDVESALMAQAVEESAFVSPFFVYYLHSALRLEIVGKHSLKPAHTALHIGSSPFPFVLFHHSFVRVAVFAEDYRAALAPSLQKFTHVQLVGADAHYLQPILDCLQLPHEASVQRPIPA